MPRSAADPPEPRGWEHALTQRVGLRVRDHRKAMRLTILELSQATAELGRSLNRMTIGNLENGHRETVSLAEIITLARALGVAPRDLAPEIDQPAADDTEVLRARVAEVQAAAAALAQWAKGRS